ncbi:MAG: DUF3352 domain-containing protein [Acidimicrobiales bacterium]
MSKSLASTLIAASLLWLLPACGGKTDEATRAAGLTPVDAVGLVTVNLDPSIEQKRNLLSIARNFPAVSDRVKGGFDQTRDELLSDLVEEGGLDFKRDVEPWLGNEVALAVLPPAPRSDAPLITLFVQTTDQGKAKAALEKSAKSGDFEGEYRVVDDFVVISAQENEKDNGPALDRIEAQSKKDDGGLARSGRFTGVTDELAGDRLILVWTDVQAALKVAEDVQDIPGLSLSKAFKKAGPVAIDLHAEKEAVVFEGVSTPFVEGKGGKAAITESLPAESLAAFTFFDLGAVYRQVLDLVGGRGGGGVDLAQEFEKQTGINLQGDILSWMEGEFVVVAGAVPEGRSFPDFGLLIEPTDQEKAKAAIPKIVQSLRDRGEIQLEETKLSGGATAYVVPAAFTDGVQPAMALLDDRFVLANRIEYLEQLAKPASPSLGDSKAYGSVVGEGSSGLVGQMVLQIDPIREAIENAFLADAEGDERADYEKEIQPNLVPLQGFGVRARHDGKFDRFEMKLTFD